MRTGVAMPRPGDLPGVLHVPLDPDDRAWLTRAPDYLRFYLAKRAYGDPKLNFAHRAFDMFVDNGTPIDWVPFEVEVRPEDMPDEAWTRTTSRRGTAKRP